ncbi:MAG: hypothetical protein AAB551_02445, partial [Patescibacteria group bacterium]
MFEYISEDPVEINKEGRILEVPSSYPIHAASEIFKMAEWIYEEFLNDCKHPLFDSNGQPLDFEGLENFRLRNTSRTISYVIHIWNIEKILNKALAELEKAFNPLPEEIRLLIRSEKEKRKTKAWKINKFRHKVAAHSSWAHYQEGDSDADREASLACWNGSFGISNSDPLSFHVGGFMPIINNTTADCNIYQLSLYEELASTPNIRHVASVGNLWS